MCVVSQYMKIQNRVTFLSQNAGHDRLVFFQPGDETLKIANLAQWNYRGVEHQADTGCARR